MVTRPPHQSKFELKHIKFLISDVSVRLAYETTKIINSFELFLGIRFGGPD